MLSYELCKQLRDSGFPQVIGDRILANGKVVSPDQMDLKDFDSACSYPTLEELIDACGEEFGCLVHMNTWWEAFSEPYKADDGLISAYEQGLKTIGETPIQAVANLYLARHDKK